MIRSLASVLLFIGLLATLPGGVGIGAPPHGSDGIRSEALVETTLRGTEPTKQPTDLDDASAGPLASQPAVAPIDAGKPPSASSVADTPNKRPVPFQARAPPWEDVPN